MPISDDFATTNLSVDAQHDLVSTVQSDSPSAAGALDTLIRAFHPALQAASHASAALDPDDAYQVAAEAFVVAVRNYDLASELPFVASISSALRRAVLREARASDLVRVKDNTAARYWRLMHKHDMDPRKAYAECVTTVNDFTPATFLAAHAALGTVEQLTHTDSDDEFLTLELTPEEHAINAAYVAWLFTTVSDVQESILRLRYGFDDRATTNLLSEWNADTSRVLYCVGDVLDDSQVSDVLGMARSTVNRQARQALAAMQAADAEALAAETSADE